VKKDFSSGSALGSLVYVWQAGVTPFDSYFYFSYPVFFSSLPLIPAEYEASKHQVGKERCERKRRTELP